MSEKKRAIVVGCGGMGGGWIKNVMSNPRTEIAALVDLRVETARQRAEAVGLDKRLCFDSLLSAVRAVKADFVIDVTVPEAHAAVTCEALRAGLPVLGEKPMAESMVSARRMVAASEETGKLYMVSQSRRYDPIHVATRDLLASGTVGDLTTINCDFYVGAHFGGFRDEMNSPLIVDMAIHHFDMARFMTGADAKSVYAYEFNPKGSWYRGDVSASVIFEMTNGIVFTYRGSWCSEGCHTSWNGDWRIAGTKGTVLMAQDKPPRGERVPDGAECKGLCHAFESFDAPAAAIDGAGIAGSLNEFVDYLETGRAPQGECHDNIKSLSMVFSAVDSSRAGARVPVV
jgi:predicted dehydrogenase